MVGAWLTRWLHCFNLRLWFPIKLRSIEWKELTTGGLQASKCIIMRTMKANGEYRLLPPTQ